MIKSIDSFSNSTCYKPSFKGNVGESVHKLLNETKIDAYHSSVKKLRQEGYPNHLIDGLSRINHNRIKNSAVEILKRFNDCMSSFKKGFELIFENNDLYVLNKKTGFKTPAIVNAGLGKIEEKNNIRNCKILKEGDTFKITHESNKETARTVLFPNYVNTLDNPENILEQLKDASILFGNQSANAVEQQMLKDFEFQTLKKIQDAASLIELNQIEESLPKILKKVSKEFDLSDQRTATILAKFENRITKRKEKINPNENDLFDRNIVNHMIKDEYQFFY